MNWTEYCKNSDAAVVAIKKLDEHNAKEQENWEQAPKKYWWDPERGADCECDYIVKESPLEMVVDDTVERTAYNLFLYYADFLDGVGNDRILRDAIEDCFDGSDDMFLVDALSKYARENHKMVGKVFDMFVEGKVELFDDGEEFFIA